MTARFRELADADPLADAPLAQADPPAGAVTCVHGDAHLANALWKDGRLTALLDFEWVRLAVRELFLDEPGQPPDDSAQRRLRRIVKSPDHLLRILPRVAVR